ncbi:hypothetical protein BU26DRAFT_526035 [Trematosphaeria pertusa]|uniref:Uncharacterized protein n=1 Tax=Trematosphaeria pertusa TaxID=390896 RepID=A0A6A6HQT4_9PLEO|nr:uncharacterized protein BU26DRAFT_526035 [Trematosphaeria pertusa]KAF2240381.1 hypothetical protein BU26DRAFT_526035 [Trematosphaeria pertusa]
MESGQQLAESMDSKTSPGAPKVPQRFPSACGLSLCRPHPPKEPRRARDSSSRSIGSRLAKVFGLRRRIQLQPQSAFLSLPLEIRHQIYLYAFASSMIHEPEKTPLSTWDHLLLSCRQVKMEMGSAPAQPIISLVVGHWKQTFPNHPLQVSATVKDGVVRELAIGVPRAVLQPAYQHLVASYIPDYISPLFRIYTDTLTLKIHDDGSPLVDTTRVPVPYHMFGQILSIVWARERTLSSWGRKIFKNPLPPPPSRHYYNAKKIVVNWQGSLAGMQSRHISLLLCMYLEWALSKPVRRVIHLRHRRFVLNWVDKSHFCIEGVSWESKTRFRR